MNQTTGIPAIVQYRRSTGFLGFANNNRMGFVTISWLVTLVVFSGMAAAVPSQLPSIKAIAASGSCSLALANDSTVWAWGQISSKDQPTPTCSGLISSVPRIENIRPFRTTIIENRRGARTTLTENRIPLIETGLRTGRQDGQPPTETEPILSLLIGSSLARQVKAVL